MCGGIVFKTSNKEEFITVYYPRPYAIIYGINDESLCIQAYWGKREEVEFKNIEVPKTGWAKLESLEKKFWDKYNYTRILIPAYKYMEKDRKGQSHWFILNDDEFIEGLFITKENLNFIYVITLSSTAEQSKIHERWVSIKNNDRYNKVINLYN
jgi:putative SOS response-associated peptidase YedK